MLASVKEQAPGITTKVRGQMAGAKGAGQVEQLALIVTSAAASAAVVVVVVAAVALSCAPGVQCTPLAIDQKQASAHQALSPSRANWAPTAGPPNTAAKTAGGQDNATVALGPRVGRPDLRRPIWALAHMVNSIKELDYRLA